MSVIGNRPVSNFQRIAKQTITGTGATAYSLDRSISSAADLAVFVNNVRQEPNVAYTAATTTITFSEAITGSDTVYVLYIGQSIGTVAHPGDQALSATTGTFSDALSGTTATFSGALSGTTGTFTGDVYAPGHVIQTVQTVYTNDLAFTGTSDVNVMAVTITPKSANSKILVTINISVSHQDSYSALVRCKRGSTFIGGGLADPASNTTIDNVWFNVRAQSIDTTNAYALESYSKSYLDSPSTTSATTYTATIRQSGPASNAGRVNKPVTTGNYQYSSRTDSIITVQEIAQ